MAKVAKSTKGTRRIFSAEFKQEAVRRMAERRARGGAPMADVFPGQGRLPSEQQEVRRLEREVQRLAQENAFLKSAAAYFARESR
ncbi:transposase [Gemmatimonas sp.]|uniref:transposase n=1 Tax=Gemmatimonas sp. TaxID=1962908 RepID=UPI003565F88B